MIGLMVYHDIGVMAHSDIITLTLTGFVRLNYDRSYEQLAQMRTRKAC